MPHEVDIDAAAPPPTTSKVASDTLKIGTDENHWLYHPSSQTYDLTRQRCPPSATLALRTTTQSLLLAPRRTALVVIDMQNFFLSEKLGRGDGGRNLSPGIARACKAVRKAGGIVVWINWGVPANCDGMPPIILRSFSLPTTFSVQADADGKEGKANPGVYTGFGSELPDGLGKLLVKDTWSADVHDSLKPEMLPEDILIDKYRISGFPGTRLEDTLRSRGIDTLIFTGVNTDQCVMSSFIDAMNLGFDVIMLDDCCATTSPIGHHSACVDNAESFMGFVSNVEWVEEGVAKLGA
ncbi:Isochorismatase hydrolase [Saitoella complicata NRRL Y-17804]|uniref:Isochorismatase-like domain-containing protein n=1 Tax=Saitoella complicata (strain BCRC 22490 / CBS 7301 / JCM 7358 / NBRC 10748 / NRRL Y-17804) TaxID=698492 RepID=A0A0E9NJJ0_SAICN|nr:Isochorismatase hydrolase [Saitoella complicata NRRL Y-17804]ODQ55136.1 Isochorismatase hydrolase [Saitoella complicata NRRL Y-17804]GAO50009.1 hypothetical protein G7K_4144-t1 [Saitoella complicata NRRL Y-17804]